MCIYNNVHIYRYVQRCSLKNISEHVVLADPSVQTVSEFLCRDWNDIWPNPVQQQVQRAYDAKKTPDSQTLDQTEENIGKPHADITNSFRAHGELQGFLSL